MYITYDTYQTYMYRNDLVRIQESSSFHPPTRFTPRNPRSGPVEIPDFKPTWLIRTSDMKKVGGSDVHEPYYALSYSWNQSGDISQQGSDSEKSPRVDNGKHRIIYYRKKEMRKTISKRRQFLLMPKTRLVKFEGLIQQICQTFNIRYIWYDQKCIDQNNPGEKRHEIRQMHKIYSNAQCTVALVPEYRMRHPHAAIGTSEWSKRIWTLQEAIMSKRLLLVGLNVHMWSYIYDGNDPVSKPGFMPKPIFAFLGTICTKPAELSVSTILWHARQRTSSKQHDWVFALANMLPKVTQELSFDYNQPLLDTMLRFYGFLVQHDLSMLCFGVPDTKGAKNDIYFQRQEDKLLPTWTGAIHSHASRLLAHGSTFDRSAINFKLDGRLLHLTCNCIPISTEQRSYTYSSESRCFEEIAGTTSFPHTSPYNRSSLVFIEASNYTAGRYGVTSTIVDLKTTHHLPIAKEGNTWTNTTSDPTNIRSITLSLTDKACTKCFILSELGFRSYESSIMNTVKVMPVVNQDSDGFYCCIGAYIEEDIGFIRNSLYTNLEKKQTFIIK